METAPSPAEVARCLEVMLPERGVGEVAFYGGSFTMLDPCLQEAYLAGVVPFVRAGRVAGIRVSTRPDGCDNERVARLRAFNVTTVELGCQSFSDAVLRKARRGHDASAAGESVMRLRNAGLRVGLQLMPGLPGGDGDEARRSLARAPNPFGATATRTRSPGTMRTCRTAGVLSFVFFRSNKGSETTEARRYPSRYARRTPSSTADSSEPPPMWTSWPISINTTAIPQS